MAVSIFAFAPAATIQVSASGNIIIRVVAELGYDYDEVRNFSEGLAAVKKDGVWSILEIVKTINAMSAVSEVSVNGEDIIFYAYHMNGRDYFKLRDIAYILNGTEKQFEVTWDSENNAINLTSGRPYTAVGGEMAGKGEQDRTAAPTASKIYLDGKEISLAAYLINGNNYFELSELGGALDFNVSWRRDGRAAINTDLKIYSGFLYLIENDEAQIFKYAGEAEHVSVPSEIEGKNVTAIGEMAFYWNQSIKSVIIPEGVRIIGDSAFQGCTSLESVTIPESVKIIGIEAFSACNFAEIIIPYGVETIRMSAFAHNDFSEIIIPDSVTIIEIYAFAYNNSLENAVLSNNLTTINSDVFWGCGSLTSIIIPEGVTAIGGFVFRECGLIADIIHYDGR
jgi:hypothetical protein